MTRTLRLSRTPTCRPLEDWKPISTELLGTQTRIVNGARWRHRVIECGAGEPLLLLHGVAGHAETFARNLHNLGQHFHVYAVDTLYHGYSSREPFDDVKRYDWQVDAIVDLLDALGHPWAHIEGESLGAMIAFELGMRYPERAGKLILNTGGLWRVRMSMPPATGHAGEGSLAELSRKAILDPTPENVRRRLEWLVRDPTRMTEEMVQLRARLYQDPDVNRAMRAYCGIEPRKDDPWAVAPCWDESDLASFKPETLVLWTEHNPGEGPEHGERIASALPGASFYLIEDAAHWPQWEKPEEHDQVLIDFITGGS